MLELLISALLISISLSASLNLMPFGLGEARDFWVNEMLHRLFFGGALNAINPELAAAQFIKLAAHCFSA